MLKAPTDFVVVFIIISVLLILGMALFIAMVIYRYQQKQNAYFKDIETLQASHENTLLQSQVEMQEQTFQNISREIHDHINHRLSLAKLYLNSLAFDDTPKARQEVSDSVIIISKAIADLRDLSRSMSSEIVLSSGLPKALEFEIAQLAKPGIYKTAFSVTGSPVIMKTGELILFRMVQEVLSNIVKHAAATVINLCLHYGNDLLTVQVQDNGKGFNTAETSHGTGLQNIKKRAAMLNGRVAITSSSSTGTEIKIQIPLYENSKAS